MYCSLHHHKSAFFLFGFSSFLPQENFQGNCLYTKDIFQKPFPKLCHVPSVELCVAMYSPTCAIHALWFCMSTKCYTPSQC